MVVEGLLRTDQLVALKQRGEVRSISSALAEVDSEAGRARLSAHLASRPFPHFEPDPDAAGVVIKIDEDGTRTRGRFVNRTFQTADDR